MTMFCTFAAQAHHRGAYVLANSSCSGDPGGERQGAEEPADSETKSPGIPGSNLPRDFVFVPRYL